MKVSPHFLKTLENSADRLRATIENAEKGTAAFVEDMEALKSNFLFRRYFKKQEKKAAKEKQ